MTPQANTERDSSPGGGAPTVLHLSLPASTSPTTDDTPYETPAASTVQSLFRENSQHILCTLRIFNFVTLATSHSLLVFFAICDHARMHARVL